MQLVFRGWAGKAVLVGLLAGSGCGGGGPEPGMLKEIPKDAAPRGFDAMLEIKKDPVKLKKMLDAARPKSASNAKTQ